MKIVLASRNKKKIFEMQTLLREYLGENIELLSLDDVGIFGDIVEDGETFEENSLIKARVAASSGYIGIADDSGLAVDALGGAPGVYSARYAGEHGSDEANNELVLKNLENVPHEKRTARFVSVIACVLPDGTELPTSRGEVEGIILREYRGEGGFGYDPLFYYPEFDKTLAEVPSSQKNTVSHRAKAILKFAKIFKNQS